MHPFGGSSRCPRCDKVVYAAEQVMGPGRKLYHKPCLSCTICKKRLDSFSLLEHDLEPYCKNCHVKNFGTIDLRQANLPNRDEVLGLTPPSTSSPRRFDTSEPSSPIRTSTPPIRRELIGGQTNRNSSYIPMLRANMNTSSPVINIIEDVSEEDDTDEASMMSDTNAGRGPGGFSRSIPPSSSSGRAGSYTTGFRAGARTSDNVNNFPATVGRANSVKAASGQPLFPLMAATGTRYGVALTGGDGKTNGGVGRWGGVTPTCPRCQKSVYFAEQVKAIGKTYHKNCLRCRECSTLLDSGRLTERDGSPFCHRCYGKLYGPQGSGYALLGKAGG